MRTTNYDNTNLRPGAGAGLNPRPRGRRGVSSVLAMLFLVLFGTLAVGFYATTNTQSQIVSNDSRAARSQMASESGLDFMRYQLARVSIPPLTPPDQVVLRLYDDLKEQLEGTGNLGGASIVLNGNTISIPGGTGTIPLDASGGLGFRATITDWLGEIVVKIDGRYGESSSLRAISMDFSRANRPITAFNYAVASKGQITMSKGLVTAVNGVDPAIASVMSALEAEPSVRVSGGEIGGRLAIVEDATVEVTGGTVDNCSIPELIESDHTDEAESPEFPGFDTSVFRPFATGVSTGSSGGTIKNVRIPANSNPTFNGNSTLQGIMFVESPNVVTINGNFTLNGFIVFDGAGDDTVNRIRISGNMTYGPVPNAPEFDAVRAVSGISILAPTTSVLMTGNAKGSMRGSIIASRFATSGNPADIVIDQGTLMTLSESADACYFDGKSIRFTATGANNLPSTSMTYNTYYQPKPITYQEVTP